MIFFVQNFYATHATVYENRKSRYMGGGEGKDTNKEPTTRLATKKCWKFHIHPWKLWLKLSGISQLHQLSICLYVFGLCYCPPTRLFIHSFSDSRCNELIRSFFGCVFFFNPICFYLATLKWNSSRCKKAFDRIVWLIYTTPRRQIFMF